MLALVNELLSNWSSTFSAGLSLAPLCRRHELFGDGISDPHTITDFVGCFVQIGFLFVPFGFLLLLVCL